MRHSCCKCSPFSMSDSPKRELVWLPGWRALVQCGVWNHLFSRVDVMKDAIASQHEEWRHLNSRGSGGVQDISFSLWLLLFFPRALLKADLSAVDNSWSKKRKEICMWVHVSAAILLHCISPSVMCRLDNNVIKIAGWLWYKNYEKCHKTCWKYIMF